jgi:hypothetical protein
MATPGQGDVIGKKPVIRPYARARMAERNVSQEAVEWVLEHYSIRRPASKKGSPAEILEGDYQGRVLKLWVKRDSDPPFIKTVAWKDE